MVPKMFEPLKFDCISIFFFRCAEITNLPLGCSMTKKAGECCPTITCGNGQTGTFQGSQTQPGTIGGYPVPQPHPTPAPTPGPGLTYAPGMVPTGSPHITVNSLGKFITVFILNYLCLVESSNRVKECLVRCFLFVCLFAFTMFVQKFIGMSLLNANSEDLDQTPHRAAFDLDLNCLPITFLWDARHNFSCLFVLRFYGPVNPVGSCRMLSVYPTTLLLGRLSSLSG